MLVLVGCGFVGSSLATEAAKRLWAHDLTPRWRTIDGDVFDDRNAANQNCYPGDAGKPKARIIAQELQDYKQNLAVGTSLDAHHVRVDETNIDALLEGSSLIIDAVDNVATRQLLWMYGVKHGVPVMHVGVSRAGTGAVEWTYRDYDTFSLSPLALAGRPLPADPDEKLKPCELLVHRRNGLLVGHAAAVALTAYMGIDPEESFESQATLTTWRVGADGVVLRGMMLLETLDPSED